jgi:hypothetical protein
MIAATQFVDLGSLKAVIARSAIVVTQPTAPAHDFADWCERQKPANIDDVILNWLRSQRPSRSSVLS